MYREIVKKFGTAILASLALTGSASADSIGSSFIGRGGGDVILVPADEAGFVAQKNWNNIDSGDTFKGTTPQLKDGAGVHTMVTLQFDASGSWNSDGSTATPNDKLFKGIIKQFGAGTSVFTFANLPTGNFDIYVYGAENAGPTTLDVIAGGVTKYWNEPAAFGGIFVESDSTTPGTYADGNYVKFSGVAASAEKIEISATYRSGSDGAGIAGIQIVRVGAFPPNTLAAQITTPPAAAFKARYDTATFSIKTTGPGDIRWLRDGAEILGATSRSYTTPILTPADNGATFTVEYKNNLNTASAQALLTVAENTVPPEFTSHPEPITRNVGNTAQFSASTTGPGVTYKWFKNGVFIPEATNSSYTTPILLIGDSGAKFALEAKNNAAAVPSKEALLTVVPNEPDTFALGAVKAEIFDSLSGVAVSDLTESQKFIESKPDRLLYLTGIDLPTLGDNYGARLTGFFIPKQSGAYDFFIRSDDASAFWISTSATPPNITDAPLITESGCCGGFMETDSGDEATTSTPIAGFVAGQQYAFVAMVKEGGGGDFLQVAARRVGDSTAASNLKPISGNSVGAIINPTGASIAVKNGPDSIVVLQGRTATLSVLAVASSLVIGNPAINYQWMKNEMDIEGATSSSFTTPPLSLGDSGAKYSVRVFSLGKTAISTEATVTVSADTTGPIAKSTAAIKGATRVGVCFNEQLDKATAETIGNYTIAGLQVTAATLQQSGNKVALTVSAPIAAAFSLKVKDVTDTFGNKAAVTDLTGSVINMISMDVGTLGEDPVLPGSTLTCAPGDFEVTAGGSDIWSSSDGIHFVYEQRTGDFDVKVRNVSLKAIAQFTGAGIMVRGDLDGDSRNWTIKTTPYNQPVFEEPGNTGSALYRTTSRKDKGGSTGLVKDGDGPPKYPNAWIRLKRTGDTFTSYQSEDGLNWKVIVSEIPPNGEDPAVPTPYPSTVYVGLATYSNKNRDNPDYYTTAVYESYGDFVPALARPILTFSQSGSQPSISWSPAGGRLQMSNNLADPNSWTDVGTANPALISISAGSQFFRVINP